MLSARQESDMTLLYSRSFGEERLPDLLVLHGLMGSSRNWLAAARDMATFARVHLLDLRNHGQSFHAETNDYPSMVGDVLAWMDHHGLAQAHVMGHSMGGKLAMCLACWHPDRLRSLIVVDNVPRHHSAYFEKEIHALAELDIAAHYTRAELEVQLEPKVPAWEMRKFLISSLVRDEENNCWRWQPNIPVLKDSLDILAGNPLHEGDHYVGSTLFLMGGNSPFVGKEERLCIGTYFPSAQVIDIPGADHNPHFSQRVAFVEEVRRFLAGQTSP
jgi:esterase